MHKELTSVLVFTSATVDLALEPAMAAWCDTQMYLTQLDPSCEQGSPTHPGEPCLQLLVNACISLPQGRHITLIYPANQEPGF